VKSVIFRHSFPFLDILDIFGHVSCQISWFLSGVRKGLFLVFFSTFHFREPCTKVHEHFLMKIEWKKVRPRKFTKVLAKMLQNQTLQVQFLAQFGRNQLLRRETIFLVEFAGNELNSLVFIKFYVFALISTQGITQDFLEGSELTSSEKKLKFHDFTQDNQRGTAPHRLLLISNFKRPGQKCFIFCFFLIET